MPSAKQPQKQAAPATTINEKAEQAKREAAEAQAVLDNPAYQKAIRIVEEAYTKQILDSDYEEAGKRERAYHLIHAIRDLERVLNGVILNGQLSRNTVNNQLAGKK